MSGLVICPECGESSSIEDAQVSNDDFAPDLENVVECPVCSHAWDLED